MKSPVAIAHIPSNIQEFISLAQDKPDEESKIDSIKFYNESIYYKNAIKIEWYERY